MVDAFVNRLRQLSASQVAEIVSAHRIDTQFYRLALELADEAGRLVGSDRVEEYGAVLKSREAEVDRTLSRHGSLADAPASGVLARGAVHALLLRDVASFNAGAFAELYAPFAAHVGLADVESDARRVVRRDTPR